MNKEIKRERILLSIIIVLMFLVLLSLVMVSTLLIRAQDDTPKTEVDLFENVSMQGYAAEPPTSPNEEASEIELQTTLKAEKEDNSKADTQTSTKNNTTLSIDQLKPGLVVDDAELTWKTETTVEVFKLVYNNNGMTTILSSNQDKVVAPGAVNKYYFVVKNTGVRPIKYDLTCRANIKTDVDGVELKVPLEAKFSTITGRYLLGDKNNFIDMSLLDGLNDSAGLYEDHYNKYILEWRWPFEIDDIYDTYLGNLAAADKELAVEVSFEVVARLADTNDNDDDEPDFDWPDIDWPNIDWPDIDFPDGGGNVSDDGGNNGDNGGNNGGDGDIIDGGRPIPDTSDSTNIAIWVGLCVCSAFAIVILLFVRRKDENEEKA